MTSRAGPTNSAVLDRARSLASDCCWMVALQARRLQTAEAEDADFLTRQMADFQFLIVALSRLRRAAQVAESVTVVSADVKLALAAFDAALPGLKTMRDVAEHMDDYAIDSAKRHDKSVDRRMLEVAAWDENVFMWLGEKLDVEAAERAAGGLFEAIRTAQRQYAMWV